MPPPVRAGVELLVAVIAGGVLMQIAALKVALGTYPTYLGKYYAMLATDPFHPAPDNPVGHRILAPLVSWAIGLRGSGLLITNLLFVLLFLAMVFYWARSRRHGMLPALFATSVMALSMPVFTTLHYGGYPDALGYLLLFGAWWALPRLWLSGALFLMATLTHESSVFLAPWLGVEAVHARRGAGARGWGGAVAMAGAVLAFLAIRLVLERAHPSVEYTAGFYLAPLLRDPLHWFRESAPHRGLGIAAAFNLGWTFALAAAAHLAVQRKWGEAGRLLLPIGCALAQLFLAYDVTRLATLAFPSVLLGVEYLHRTDAWRARA